MNDNFKTADLGAQEFNPNIAPGDSGLIELKARAGGTTLQPDLHSSIDAGINDQTAILEKSNAKLNGTAL